MPRKIRDARAFSGLLQNTEGGSEEQGVTEMVKGFTAVYCVKEGRIPCILSQCCYFFREEEKGILAEFKRAVCKHLHDLMGAWQFIATRSQPPYNMWESNVLFDLYRENDSGKKNEGLVHTGIFSIVTFEVSMDVRLGVSDYSGLVCEDMGLDPLGFALFFYDGNHSDPEQACTLLTYNRNEHDVYLAARDHLRSMGKCYGQNDTAIDHTLADFNRYSSRRRGAMYRGIEIRCGGTHGLRVSPRFPPESVSRGYRYCFLSVLPVYSADYAVRTARVFRGRDPRAHTFREKALPYMHQIRFEMPDIWCLLDARGLTDSMNDEDTIEQYRRYN